MPLDFTKLSTGSSVDTVVSPTEIFRALPAKKPKYKYLRDVQSEVLERWFSRRAEKDTVIKMNTGSGKSLVGLLLLKSCINEGNFPAFYITPDPYLTKQIIREAEGLGIATTDDPRSVEVSRGQAICLINIYKLVNGLSVFGVKPNIPQIPISSIVIDDAHACLSATESQFTLTIDSESNPEEYGQLFTLFKDDLSQQSEIGALEVESGDPTRDMLVPYWAWINKQKDVIRIFHNISDTDKIKFVWPLIKDQLYLCRCVFGGGKIEISSRCIPINAIPSFVEAKQRIYMTATLADDNILVSNFDASPEAITKPITPKIANDIGDRMIVVPQELSSNITDDEIKNFLAGMSKKYNVVVIVPSNYRATYWADVATMTLVASNLYNGIKELEKKHVGLVVMVNKYDGVDLPDDSCRIIVIDGLPDVRRKIDKIEQIVLMDSEIVLSQQIQRIEQGMGRGIRSNDDHCVVFLMGANLVKNLYTLNALRFFSPATKAQFELSEKIAEQVRRKNLKEIEGVINYCLNKDPQWLKVSKGALVSLKYAEEGKVDLITLKQRKAFDYAQIKQFDKSIEQIQEAVNAATEDKIKGWLKSELAEYTHYLNPSESQEILKSALGDNPRVLKPLGGITYQKLILKGLDQAKQCFDYLKKYSDDTNKMIIYINGIIDELRFMPESHKRFEQAMKELAMILGFIGQRPESELGKGPDVLWGVGDLKYFIISCKNEAESATISKTYCDNLSGAMHWFHEKYDKPCKGVPVIVHPSDIVEYQASPDSQMRVVEKNKLELLKKAILDFGKNIASPKENFNVENISKALIKNCLSTDKFIETFTVKYNTEKRKK